MNKMKKKSKLFVWLCIGIVVLTGGCSSKKSDQSYSSNMSVGISASQEADGGWSSATEDSMSMTTESSEEGQSYDSAVTTNQQTASEGRKLIKRVNLDVESLEFDSFMTFLNQTISRYSGYIEDSSIYNGSYDYKKSRNASITIRIPSDSLDVFVNQIGEEAYVTNKYESAEDITLSYLDTESRKKALEIQQDRLLALLEKAETMEDIIAIEARLSEVTYDLESAQSTINNYDNLVAYSTVTINLYEVTRITEPEDESAASRIKSGLDNTFYNIKESTINLTISFITNLPYILIIAFLAFIIITLYNTRKSRRLKKQQALAQAINTMKNTPSDPQDKQD